MEFNFTTIDFPGADWTYANGITRSGPLKRAVHIVGTYGDVSGTHGFSYSCGQYATLDVPGYKNTAAYGINGRGQIVGTYEVPQTANQGGYTQGFVFESGTHTRWSQGEAGRMTKLYGINYAGSCVGSVQTDEGVTGLVFDAVRDQGFEVGPIGPHPFASEVRGINYSGQCVGSSVQTFNGPSNGLSSPTIIGGYAPVDAPGAYETNLTGINDDGVICGYADYPGSGERAVVDDHGTLTLEFPKASSTKAFGITNPIPGQTGSGFAIVGNYSLPTDRLYGHGFLATPVLETLSAP